MNKRRRKAELWLLAHKIVLEIVKALLLVAVAVLLHHCGLR